MLRLVPIVYGFLALTFRNKYVQRTLQAYSNRYIDIFTPAIQRGIDSGEFRAVDAREVAIASNAIVEGTILLWVYNHEAIDPARHIRSGLKILLEGLQAPTLRICLFLCRQLTDGSVIQKGDPRGTLSRQAARALPGDKLC